MKTLDDYMAMNYRMEIVEDKDEGGYAAYYPELPGCVTCGETVERAAANALTPKELGWRLLWRKASRYRSPMIT